MVGCNRVHEDKKKRFMAMVVTGQRSGGVEEETDGIGWN